MRTVIYVATVNPVRKIPKTSINQLGGFTPEEAWAKTIDNRTSCDGQKTQRQLEESGYKLRKYEVIVREITEGSDK